ncbi:MAG: hypothetical protein ACP5RS_01325 [Thermoplasmata archaeon]
MYEYKVSTINRRYKADPDKGVVTVEGSDVEISIEFKKDNNRL